MVDFEQDNLDLSRVVFIMRLARVQGNSAAHGITTI
jgi:hypothetical protein